MRWYVLLLALLLVDVCQISDVSAAKGKGAKICPRVAFPQFGTAIFTTAEYA